MRALERGAKNYTAVDVIGDQLRILAKRVRDNEAITGDRLSALRLIDGAFPDTNVVEELDSDYDAIIATRDRFFLFIRIRILDLRFWIRHSESLFLAPTFHMVLGSSTIKLCQRIDIHMFLQPT
jgi:hypothetical protein